MVKFRKSLNAISSLQIQVLERFQLVDERMEETNKKMESLFSGLDGKINAICREKRADTGSNDHNTPLLLTTSKLRGEDGESSLGGKEKWGKNPYQFGPRIDLLMFLGEHPREWLRKCEKFFLAHQIPEIQKIEVVETYLEGKVDIWFQGIKLSLGKPNWEDFKENLTSRFGGRCRRDVVEEFNKLQQKGSLVEYQEQFEELRSLMMGKNPHLSESYFVSSFISGLKVEIKPMLHLLKPITFQRAF